MIFIIISALLSFTAIVHSATFTELQLPSTTKGPDSSAFDSSGAGPYTGVSDGRILKYQGPGLGFTDFATTSPIRSKPSCDGTNNPALGPICGRPLGLGFNNLTGDLYIADIYRGLLVVGKNGGLATQLATAADGVPFVFPDGLDVDPITGIVYFTDLGFDFLAVSNSDVTGRLLKYDPITKQVTVLLDGLRGPAGVAVSNDGTYVLVTEFIGDRIQKYFLTGPNANTAQVIISLQGRPDNIKRTPQGDFLVAFNEQTQPSPPLLVGRPTALRIDGNGTVLASEPLDAQYGTTFISEVQDFKGSRYVGSLFTSFIGVYKP